MDELSRALEIHPRNVIDVLPLLPYRGAEASAIER